MLKKHSYFFALTFACLAGALWRIPLPDLLNEAPPLLQNYAKHVYFINLHARTFCEWGDFWGYDPTYSGGILTGSGWFISFLFPSIISCITSISSAVILKWMLFSAFAFSPLLLYAGSRGLGLDDRQSAIAGFGELLLIQCTLRSMIVLGSMVEFVLGVCLILPLMGLMMRLNRNHPRPFWSAAAIAGFGILAGSFNPHALLPMAVCTAGVCWVLRSVFFTPRGIVAMILGAAAIPIILWPWAAPGFRFVMDVKNEYHYFRFIPLSWNPFNSWKAFFVFLQPVGLMLIVLGILGTRTAGRQYTTATRLCLILFLVFAAAVAGVILSGQGANTFPMRYIDFALSLLTVPAAIWLAPGSEIKVNHKKRIFLYLLVVIAAGVNVYPFATTRMETKTPPQTEKMVQWLRTNTDPTARILFETSHNTTTDNQFDIAGLLAFWVPQREFVTIPTTESLGYVHTAFLEGILNKMPIEVLSDRYLEEYFRLYNIGWIVAISAKSKARFSQCQGFIAEKEQIGPYTMYQVLRTPSYFLAGNGKVEAELNRIHLTDLEPDPEGKVVLCYNWFATLSSSTDTPVIPYAMPLAPIAFIQLNHPPGELTIQNDASKPFPGFQPWFGNHINWIIKQFEIIGVDMDVPYGTGIRIKPGATPPFIDPPEKNMILDKHE